MRKRNALILLAGGKGKRMGSDIPKQFLDIGGQPLISLSLNAIQKSDLIDECILLQKVFSNHLCCFHGEPVFR